MSELRVFDQGSYRIEIAPDGLTATLIACSGVELSAAAIIGKLESLGIKKFDGGELIAALQTRTAAELLLVVARGTPPVNERQGKVEFHLPIADAETGLFTKAVSGQFIATVDEPTPGVDGVDVFGGVVPHQKAGEFTPGAGVKLLKGELTATAIGNVRFVNGVISVHPLMEIHADDDAGKIPNQYDGDVAIKGSLRDGRSLEIKGCLLVGGAVEAASFNAGGWVHIKGGIVGRDKGTGIVGGDLYGRFASGAHLSVTGDIHLQSELANSHVVCGGALTVARGPITGGSTAANRSITCHTLGNPAGVKTIVEAGTDEHLRAILMGTKPEVDANRKRIADVRAKIAPLMQRQKSLTPQQREKATELLFEADELEETTEATISRLAERCQNQSDKSLPEIHVAETLYPGVVIRFPGVEAAITSAIKGPIRVFPRKLGNVIEIVVEEATGSCYRLPATVVADHFSPFVKWLTAEKAAA